MSRAIKMAELLRKEISDIIRNKLRDRNVGFASITMIEVSRDLEHARVYVSVLGAKGEQKRTIEVLKKASGYIRHELGKILEARIVPFLTFKYDDSLERGDALISKIDAANRPE